VTDDRCPVISISRNYCGGPDSFYTGVLDPLFAQAAAQGQSVITITADYGAAYLAFDPLGATCVPGTTRAINELAADPNVTALGGTQFFPEYTNGNVTGPVPENVWNDLSVGISFTGSFGATGGGVSSIFTKPTFQAGLGVPNDGMRDVPDVSLIASPNYPGSWVVADASCFKSNGCTGKGGLSYAELGGTSLSGAVFAGIANLVGQAVGGPLGNMNPTIYALANNDLAGSGFRDVTTGDNTYLNSASNPPVKVQGYSAGPGYDLATGWGTVDIATFLTAYSNTLPGPAGVMLSPAKLNFNNVPSGTISKPQVVTIKVPNRQKAWTLVSSVAGSGAFAAAQTCVGKWIGPGDSCEFGVTFSPVGAGPVGPLALTVIVHAGNSPQTIPLSGFGK